MKNENQQAHTDTELRYIRRDIDALTATTKDGFTQMAAELKILREGFVTQKTFSEAIADLQKDIDKKASMEKFTDLEDRVKDQADSNKKIVFIILGAIILSVLAAIGLKS